MAGVHHSGLCPRDMELSLRFYVDGIGLEVLFDVTLAADLEPLLGEHTDKVRTVFLGTRGGGDAGTLELLDVGTDRVRQQEPASGLPQRGLFLLSFQVPVEAALSRLAALGLGGPPRRMVTPGGGVAATVVDPDGVVVELLDQPMALARSETAGSETGNHESGG